MCVQEGLTVEEDLVTAEGSVPEEQTETIPQGMQCNFCDPIAFVDDADRFEYINYGQLEMENGNWKNLGGLCWLSSCIWRVGQNETEQEMWANSCLFQIVIMWKYMHGPTALSHLLSSHISGRGWSMHRFDSRFYCQICDWSRKYGQFSLYCKLSEYAWTDIILPFNLLHFWKRLINVQVQQ